MTAADVEASLRTLLPDVPVEDLARLATLVADIVGGVLPPEAARSRLAADPCSALLQLLAGRSIGVGTSVINFGTSNNFRDVAFGSVAGHDVVNITFNLNIAGPTTTQTTDPRAFDLIDTIRATVRADQFDERIGEAEDAREIG